jgi:hypothetical protein
MSLINEALRKAQNQRAQSTGLGSDTKKPSLNHTGRPNRFGLMAGLGIFIVILIGLVAGLTVILLSKDKSQTVQASAPVETVASASKTAVQPNRLEPGTEPGTESGALDTVSPVPENSEQLPETVEKPAVTAELNQAIIDWLAQSNVTGVRITSSSSKVILNNDAFTPCDKVNMALDLEIFEIEAKRIIFIDSKGVKYVKQI